LISVAQTSVSNYKTTSSLTRFLWKNGEFFTKTVTPCLLKPSSP
jgi:hypothetical protein